MFDARPVAARRRFPAWFLALGMLLGLNLLALLYVLLRDERGVTLQDHSRYGTWLNDQRVLGRTNVLAGDRMRLGDPGIEFGFVAVGEADGPSQG